MASLDAYSRIFQGRKSGLRLWEEPCLHLPGKFQLLVRAVFGFEPLGMRAAMLLNFARDLLVTQKRKRISVHIFEGCRDGAPGLRLRWMMKADPALAPFFELGNDIFGQENNFSGPANELVLFRAGLRSN